MSETMKEPKEDISLDCLKVRLSELYGALDLVLQQAESVESIGTMLPKMAEAETGPTEAKKDFPLLEELHRSVDLLQKRTDVIRATLVRGLDHLRKKK